MSKRKSSAGPKSAAIIGGNQDLLIEILSFTPAKSLIRFKSVNKQWLSIISAPSFHRLHALRQLQRPKPQPSLLLHSTNNTSKFFYCNPTLKKLIPFDFNKFIKYSHMKVMQSCNGLLLLEACKITRYTSFKEYYVYNPSTKQSRNLMITKPFNGLLLAFDPMKSPHYKVILLARKGQSQYTVDVYDSETHTWKRWTKSQSIFHWLFHNVVYYNDLFYFVRPGGLSYYLHVQEIEESVERTNIISQPRRGNGSRRRVKSLAMESNGHLHAIMLSSRPGDHYVDVFELNKSDLSWFKKHHIDLSPVAGIFTYDNDLVNTVLGIVRGDDDGESVLLFHKPGKIMCYRFQDNSFEVLVNFRREKYYKVDRVQFDFDHSYQFIETFAPV